MPKFEQFYAIRRLSSVGWSASGRHLLYTIDTSGQFELWRQGVTPDGAAAGCAVQVTALNRQTVRGFAVAKPVGAKPSIVSTANEANHGSSPHGSAAGGDSEKEADDGEIALLADQDGDERFQVLRMTSADSWPERISRQDEVQYLLTPGAYSPDGRRVAFTGTESRPTDMEAIVVDLTTGTQRSVASQPGRNRIAASWSPDGKHLVIVEEHHNLDADLYLAEVDDGGADVAELLTPHTGDAVYEPGPWLADGSGFFLLTNQESELSYLAFYHLAERQIEPLRRLDWDVTQVDLSADERHLFYVVNEDGYSRLYVINRPDGSGYEVKGLPRGVIAGMVASPATGSPLVALVLTTATRPADAYVYNVETGALQRLTHNHLGHIAEEAMVAPELVHFHSFDGRQIPAWLYKPRRLEADGRCSLVLSIHGGPEAQELPLYMYGGLYQVLLDRGIGVLAPNVRGSTGYGRTYQQLIYRDWGGAELRDFQAAADFARSLEWVDPERLGVFGGSFGGFATLSCVTRLPEYWATGVAMMGPSNLVTFARAVPPSWRKQMATWVGDPDEDREMLLQRSPITYVDQVRCPMLVIQGAQDFRVVKSESDQMVEAMRARGREVEYVVYEDEGHGFVKRENGMDAWRRTADWLSARLLR